MRTVGGMSNATSATTLGLVKGPLSKPSSHTTEKVADQVVK